MNRIIPIVQIDTTPKKDLDFTVSARSKKGKIQLFLNNFYRGLSIKSVFGFTEFCKLYGGRTYSIPELNDDDIAWMYDHNINYRIPLTGLRFGYEHYKESLPFLRKYHRKGNSVIAVRHDFAEWVRNDFPDYEIEASVIHKISKHSQIVKLQEIFDTIVLDPVVNSDAKFLSEIENKDRIRLFANIGCMLRCPTRECYPSHSENNVNARIGAKHDCCQNFIFEKDRKLEFDVTTLVRMGFTKFKKLRFNEMAMF